MNWKTKARIQRACASLPAGRQTAYYLLQRYGGSLRHARDPRELLQAGASLVQDLQKCGFSVAGKRVMEIGTGRYLELPISMFLAGARSILTVDLNPLLKQSLVLESLQQMLAHRDEIAEYFSGLQDSADVAHRLNRLSRVKSLVELSEVASIEYRAPADAARTGLESGSIDVQFSYTVFEHIPREALVGILREAARILSPDGAAIHHIDPSDHCAHDDPSISLINFLQFSDEEWDRIAGNTFAYHNRLRASDYQEIYREAGHQVLLWDAYVNPDCKKLLENSFPLAAKFRNRPIDDLASVVVRVISRPQPITGE